MKTVNSTSGEQISTYVAANNPADKEPKKRKQRRKKEIPADKLERVLEMNNQGKSLEEMAKFAGVHHQTLLDILGRQKINTKLEIDRGTLADLGDESGFFNPDKWQKSYKY